jgi:hypothetical protein
VEEGVELGGQRCRDNGGSERGGQVSLRD